LHEVLTNQIETYSTWSRRDQPKRTTQWSVIATTQCFSQHGWHCD